MDCKEDFVEKWSKIVYFEGKTKNSFILLTFVLLFVIG